MQGTGRGRGTPAGIWLRVSTADQSEESQEPDCRSWCADHGYTVAEVYRVHGKSAYHGEQDPDWTRVVADVRTGKVAVVVIWKIDRLDRRNMLHAVPMVNRVLDAGGRIEFASQPSINLTTMPGRMAFGNLCEMAYEESRTKSDRILSKHEFIRAGGGVTGKVPWGYVPAGPKYRKRPEPTADGSRYVPEIYRRVAAGESLETVATWLRESGIWPKVSRVTVGRLVRKRDYMGTRLDRHRRVVGECPPLVDAKLWQAANRRLDSTKRGRRGPASGHAPFLAPGKCVLFCDVCEGRGIESPMYRIHPPGQPFLYRCAGAFPERKGCGNVIDLKATDQAALVMLALSPAPWTEMTFIPGSNHDAEIDQVRLALADLPNQGFSDEQEDAARRNLRAERDRLAALPATPDQWRLVPTGETVGQHWAKLDTEGQRQLMRDRVRFYASRGPAGWRAPILRLESDLFTFEPADLPLAAAPVYIPGVGEVPVMAATA